MSKSFRLFLLWGIVNLVVIMGPHGNASERKPMLGPCGDFNNSGSFNDFDLFTIAPYLYSTGAPPSVPTQADCDNYLLITARDFQAMGYYFFAGGPFPTCPVTHTEPIPIDTTTVVTVAGFAPAFSTSTELVVALTHIADSLTGFTLPLQVLLEGNPVSFSNFTFSAMPTGWDVWPSSTPRTDAAQSVVLLTGCHMTHQSFRYLPPGTHGIIRMQVSYPASDTARDFTYAWKTLRPISPITTGYPDTSLIPQVLGPYPNGSQVSPVLASTRIKRGDADGNGSINILDLNFLVAYIFGGGPAPSDLSAGDVNCTNSLNVLDVNYLIAYFFAGGPVPCAG